MPPKGKSRVNRRSGPSLEMSQYLDAGANKIKKRIRDLERLLSKKRDMLPDTVIIEKERTLQALYVELENVELKQKAKKIAAKYHMVRFFERKKALRRYKQAVKEFEEDPEKKKLKKQMQQREIDLCYVVNFPKVEKYLALYASEGDEPTDSKTTQKRDAFRKLVAKELKKGTLPVPLEDILKGKKLEKDSIGVSLESRKTRKIKQHKVKAEVENSSEEEEDDFFE
ncbi:Efg1p KNAG_0K00260 [Huiozyma naganishii CBS 8797]|uniref:rRNA-processing protein EFG1 n=1 Tax=Huiozyma naganishii (strain ATCC MYA-139 / BCRC 22969 / CBS 8797 / KCTC 17520 / NBRC 10181 / NCYC 3082 / Yp74L-3) TaxID=1071383 RepID=J7S9Z5_HUIN7|nr:hypothetical protein KNAG_0K00260 [Kazachstania naganishii CBS 8797]CCK72394.1 hypothetical protein KNAG_0K00260 [Kazachstania naganishii CBS 8797]